MQMNTDSHRDQEAELKAHLACWAQAAPLLL
jgi:hypothetical protein